METLVNRKYVEILGNRNNHGDVVPVVRAENNRNDRYIVCTVWYRSSTASSLSVSTLRSLPAFRFRLTYLIYLSHVSVANDKPAGGNRSTKSIQMATYPRRSSSWKRSRFPLESRDDPVKWHHSLRFVASSRETNH